MADHYTEFSFVLDELTDNERSWLKEALDYIEETGDSSDDLDKTHELYPVLSDTHCDGCGVGFSHSFQDDGLWLRGEASGPDDAIPLLETFMNKFRPGRKIGFGWANTCSKPRPDGFGGGAVVITGGGDTKWMSTYSWMREEMSLVVKATPAPDPERRTFPADANCTECEAQRPLRYVEEVQQARGDVTVDECGAVFIDSSLGRVFDDGGGGDEWIECPHCLAAYQMPDEYDWC